MNILLINPANPENIGRDQHTGDILASLCQLKTDVNLSFGLPLALTTLAALTPKNHSVKILDEMIETIDYKGDYDIVGISAMTFKAKRAYKIAEKFRQRGITVILGGIHASMCPDEASEYVDCVVIGEAEELWPTILKDFENGNLKSRYKADEFTDISKIPSPKYNLMHHDRYLSFFVQTTRGCPYSCKFCIVNKFSGKEIRKKTPEQVIKEIEAFLQLPFKCIALIDNDNKGKRAKLITTSIFFTDDNFAIDRKHALAICKALKDFQDKKRLRLNWFTQVNYKVGLDDELLTAMKESGCRGVLMGFESLDQETLVSLKKDMNSPELYSKSINNVKKYGIDIIFSMILGPDAKKETTYTDIINFVEKNNIFTFSPNILTPLPGTVLLEEMKKNNKLISYNTNDYNLRTVVFKPKYMKPHELQNTFNALCKRLLSFDNLLKRGKLSLKSDHQQYSIPLITRIIILLLYSFSLIKIFLKKKISLIILFKGLWTAPGLFLLNDSLATINILSTCIEYSTFSKSLKKVSY